MVASCLHPGRERLDARRSAGHQGDDEGDAQSERHLAVVHIRTEEIHRPLVDPQKGRSDDQRDHERPTNDLHIQVGHVGHQSTGVAFVRGVFAENHSEHRGNSSLAGLRALNRSGHFRACAARASGSYEPATGNFIQQLDGKVIDGPDAGKSLEAYSVTLSEWGDWKRLHPETTLYHAPAVGLRDKLVAWMLQVMIPIAKLSKRSKPWHRVRGSLDKRLPAMSMVMGVEVEEDSCAYPVDALRKTSVMNDTVGRKPIALFYDLNYDLGAVYSRQVGSMTLNFVPSVREGTPVVAADRETGTQWTMTGEAFEGPLLGRSLQAVPHVNKLFWFSRALFKPGTRVGLSVLAAA